MITHRTDPADRPNPALDRPETLLTVEDRPAAPSNLPALRHRVCGSPGCTAHLSRYNDTTTCWLHGPGADPLLRQTR